MKAKKILSAIAYFALALIIGIVLGIWQTRPPTADETCPAFQRMMYNIERLAVEPRVVGTEELDRARAKIIAEIEDMGLTPVVHSRRYTQEEAYSAWTRLRWSSDVPLEPLPIPYPRRRSRFDSLPDEFYVHNIFVRLEAPNSDRTIMFVSHYDSWPNSPGAADAMTPIAAMLEAMRSQANNRTLANNIYFLMTDGEEFAAIGVLAFIQDHPELRDRIDLIVNLEAQGNSGGLILFETSPNPHSMLNVFRRAVPRPLGLSLGQTIYEAMRTYTDFNFFRQYGWRGINLAIIDGHEHYHRPTDTFENLNRNTAWHYLTTTLGLADYAANNSLERLGARPRRAIFFPFLPGNMVVISSPWIHILRDLAIALAITFFVYERKTKKTRVTIYSIYLLFLAALSIVATIFVPTGEYLVWLPLLVMSVTAFLKKWIVAYRVAQLLSRITVLLLWVPLVYLVLLVL